MALVIPGQTVTDIRGSVGSLVAKGVRGGLSVQTQPLRRLRASKARTERSGEFTDTARLWSTLSPAARVAWDTASGTATGGFGLFMRVVFMRHDLFGMWDFTPPAGNVQGRIARLGLDVALTGPKFEISWVIDGAIANEVLVVWFGLFGSATAAEPRQGWMLAGAMVDAVTQTIDLGSILYPGPDVFHPGRSVGIESAIWSSAAGQFSQRIRAKTIVGS